MASCWEIEVPPLSWIGLPCISAEAWGSWAQAIFTVVAILASAGLTVWQLRWQAKKNRELREEDRIERLQMRLGPFIIQMSVINKLLKQELAQYPVDGEYEAGRRPRFDFAAAPEIKRHLELLRELPKVEIPRDVVNAIVEFETATDDAIEKLGRAQTYADDGQVGIAMGCVFTARDAVNYAGVRIRVVELASS